MGLYKKPCHNRCRSQTHKVDQTILWQYTTLESGMHFSYPAKSAFPENYSPKQQAWYTRAVVMPGVARNEFVFGTIMTIATEKEYTHIGETSGCENHDHDLVHELSRRLDGLWRYDQYISNAEGQKELQEEAKETRLPRRSETAFS